MHLETIYLVHHTHTDVGFTNDQPVFWEMQYRFIDEALRLIDKYADSPEESRFRWTVETTCGLDEWLKTASSRDIDRLIAADKAGYIEVMAMQTNNTPLFNNAQLIESLQPVHRLRRDLGLDIRYAMNCDINGQNWTMTDTLLDAGIEGFSMAINHHFGGPPHPRPYVFQWETPSGRALPAHNGWQYSKANDFGLYMDDDDLFVEWLPKIEAWLTEINYPLPFIVLEGYHPYGDNGSAWGAFAEFAKRWNESGRAPKLMTATPRMFWQQVKAHQNDLPKMRGDWTDYWNFGCISTARETTISLTTRSRLGRADAFNASLKLLNKKSDAKRWSERTFPLHREEAWHALDLYGEHTWGGEMATLGTSLDDSRAMDNHKKQYAYQARSLSLLLERDALADLARFIPRSDASESVVFNPLPWERTIYGPIGKHYMVPRGMPEDPSASRHYFGHFEQPTDFWTNRSQSNWNGGMGWLLQPVKVPALGYTVVGWDAMSSMVEAEEGDAAVVENDRFIVTFDKEKGGVRSLFDKQLNREWVDASAGHPLHGFVHEEVANHDVAEPRKELFEINWAATTETNRGWHPDWQAIRTSPSKVLLHKTYRLPYGIAVEQVVEHSKIGRISQRVFLPDDGSRVEFQSEWQMGTTEHPEATYLLFPFALPGAQARYNIDGVAVRPHLDQLPGSCRDYFTVQNWVDFNDGKFGMTVALPENPMVQLGDFNFAKDQQELKSRRALLLGWVTNNYWETNFPAAQPGVVCAHYALRPYEGKFDEAAADRFAVDYENARPVLQPLGEPAEAEQLPASGTLLNLPQPPVLVENLRATAEGALLTLFNASDDEQTAVVSSAIVRFTTASRCDLFGVPLEPLAVKDGSVSISIAPRRTYILEIK
jgi:alpha-mannosidase